MPCMSLCTVIQLEITEYVIVFINTVDMAMFDYTAAIDNKVSFTEDNFIVAANIKEHVECAAAQNATITLCGKIDKS